MAGSKLIALAAALSSRWFCNHVQYLDFVCAPQTFTFTLTQTPAPYSALQVGGVLIEDLMTAVHGLCTCATDPLPPFRDISL